MRETLATLISYYLLNRGVGHTKAQVEGLGFNPNTIVLSRTIEEGRRITRENLLRNKVINLDSLSRGSLNGLREPLVITHEALVEILSKTHDELLQKDAKIYSLEYNLDYTIWKLETAELDLRAKKILLDNTNAELTKLNFENTEQTKTILRLVSYVVVLAILLVVTIILAIVF